MISDNPNSVAAVNAVLAFFEFVQNPEKFKGIITELRAVNEERKKVTGLYQSVEDFNRKSEAATLDLAKRSDALRAEKAAHSEQMKKDKDALAKHSSEVANRERRATELSSQATRKSLDLASRDAALAEAERRLAAQRVELDARMEALKAAELENSELRKKLDAALKAI